MKDMTAKEAKELLKTLKEDLKSGKITIKEKNTKFLAADIENVKKKIAAEQIKLKNLKREKKFVNGNLVQIVENPDTELIEVLEKEGIPIDSIGTVADVRGMGIIIDFNGRKLNLYEEEIEMFNPNRLPNVNYARAAKRGHHLTSMFVPDKKT